MKLKGSVYFASDLFKFMDFGDEAPLSLAEGETFEAWIPIFREGKFKHPWYGELDFTGEYLDKIVENHKLRRLPYKVSFDESHMPDKGAIGWVEDWENGLEIRNVSFQTATGVHNKRFIFAKAELNPYGYSLIRNKRFRYFSSEIHPNYSTREVESVKTSDGEAETVLEFGPVLQGGGLTNRPFIPHLGEIQFSENVEVDPEHKKEVERQMQQYSRLVSQDDEEVQDTWMFVDVRKEIQENPERKKQIFSIPSGPAPQVNSEEVIAEDVIAHAEPAPVESENGQREEDILDFSNEEKQGESIMKFSELLTAVNKLEQVKDQIAYIEENAAKFSDEQRVLVDSLLDAKQQAFAAEQARDEAIQRKQLAEEKANKFSEENARLKTDLVEAKEGSWQSQVKVFCSELREADHHESVVKKVEQILTGLKREAREFKFSVIEGEDTRELNLIKIFSEVLETLPKDARIDLSEQTSANEEHEVPAETQVDPVKQLSEPTPAEPKSNDEEVPKGVQVYADLVGGLPPKDMWDAIREDGSIDVDKLG